MSKIWGVYSCDRDAILALGKDRSVGTSKRGRGSPSWEAFKPQEDKATATLTSCWRRSCCESGTGFDASRAPRSHQTLGVSGRTTPRGCFQRLDLSCQQIQVLCTQAEDHASYSCFSAVTLLPAWLWSRAATEQAKRLCFVGHAWTADGLAATEQ